MGQSSHESGNLLARGGRFSRRALLIGSSSAAGAAVATVFWNEETIDNQKLPTPKPTSTSTPVPDTLLIPEAVTPVPENEQRYAIKNWDVLFTIEQLAGFTQENSKTTLSIGYEQTPGWKYKVIPAEQIEVQNRRIETTYDSQLVNDTPGSPRVVLHGLDLPNPYLVIKKENFDNIYIDKIPLAFLSESEFINQERSHIYKPEVRSASKMDLETLNAIYNTAEYFNSYARQIEWVLITNGDTNYNITLPDGEWAKGLAVPGHLFETKQFQPTRSTPGISALAQRAGLLLLEYQLEYNRPANGKWFNEKVVLAIDELNQLYPGLTMYNGQPDFSMTASDPESIQTILLSDIHPQYFGWITRADPYYGAKKIFSHAVPRLCFQYSQFENEYGKLDDEKRNTVNTIIASALNVVHSIKSFESNHVWFDLQYDLEKVIFSKQLEEKTGIKYSPDEKKYITAG